MCTMAFVCTHVSVPVQEDAVPVQAWEPIDAVQVCAEHSSGVATSCLSVWIGHAIETAIDMAHNCTSLLRRGMQILILFCEGMSGNGFVLQVKGCYHLVY